MSSFEYSQSGTDSSSGISRSIPPSASISFSTPSKSRITQWSISMPKFSFRSFARCLAPASKLPPSRTPTPYDVLIRSEYTPYSLWMSMSMSRGKLRTADSFESGSTVATMITSVRYASSSW